MKGCVQQWINNVQCCGATQEGKPIHNALASSTQEGRRLEIAGKRHTILINHVKWSKYLLIILVKNKPYEQCFDYSQEILQFDEFKSTFPGISNVERYTAKVEEIGLNRCSEMSITMLPTLKPVLMGINTNAK